MYVGGVNKIAVKATIVFLLVLFVIVVPVMLSSPNGLTSRLQADADEPDIELSVPQTQEQKNSLLEGFISNTETTSTLSGEKPNKDQLDEKLTTNLSNSTNSDESNPLTSTQAATSPAKTTQTTDSITTPNPIGPTFSNSFSPSGYSGWYIQTSGSQETVTRSADYFECTVGGYDSLYHYARLRRSLPNEDKLALTKTISAELDFEIPADFYDKQEAFIRILSFDNYADFINGTDQKLGSDETDEWRLGLVIYNSDKLLRLDSEHKRNENLTLWELPTRLEPGRHTIKLDIALSQTSTGSWSIILDGKNVGSATNVQTIPSTLTKPEEREITQITTCLDGSSSQDTTPVSLRIRSITASGS